MSKSNRSSGGLPAHSDSIWWNLNDLGQRMMGYVMESHILSIKKIFAIVKLSGLDERIS